MTDFLLPGEEGRMQRAATPSEPTFLLPGETLAEDRARQNVSILGAGNPDKVAEARRLSTATGIPTSVIGRNPDRAKIEARLREIDSLIKETPVLAKAYADPAFAEIAHDDGVPLSNVAKQVAPPKPVVTNSEFGEMVRRARKENPALDWDTARSVARSRVSGIIADDEPRMGPATRPNATPGNLLSGLGVSFVESFEQMRQGLRRVFGDVSGFDEMAADAARKNEQSQFRELVGVPNPEGDLGSVYRGVQSTLQTAPIIATGFASGGTSLALMGLQQGLPAYSKYRDRGGAIGESLLGASGEGIAEAAFEKAPMGYFVKKFGRTGAPEFIAGLLAKELPSEIATTVAQTAIDTAVANPNKTWAQWASELPANIRETVIATLTQSAIMGGVGAGVNKLGARSPLDEQAEKAHVAINNFQALQNIFAAPTLTRDRDPSAYAKFVNDAAEEGPVQNLYVDARTLLQSGVDLQPLAQARPELQAEIMAKAATGGDVAIPLGEYTAFVAPQDSGNVLLQNLRTSEDGLTQAEAQTYMQSQGEQIKAQTEKLIAQAQEDDARTKDRKAVEAAFLEELTKVNRFTKDVNTNYAQLIGAISSVMAHRLARSGEAQYAGMTAQRFAQMFKLLPAAENVAGVSSYNSANAVEQGANDGRPESGLRRDGADQNVFTTVSGKPASDGWDTATRIRGKNGLLKVHSGRASGRPISVESFDPKRLSGGTGRPSSGLGIWFSSSESEARGFGGYTDSVYLDLRNPKVYRSGSIPGLDTVEEAQALQKQLIAEGYDGIIIDNRGLGKPEVHFVAFSPDQIIRQGATLNQGANSARSEQAGNGAGGYSRGGLAPLAGAPTVEGASGPDPRLVAVAEQYARDNGINLGRQAEYANVDPERAKRIAAAYDAMEHAPQDPAVQEAYANLIAQTLAQYRALEAAGYKFYLIDETNDPYAGNPWNAMRDLRANQTMAVFATEAGFGTQQNFDPSANPLLADTGIVWPYGSLDGPPKRVLANDLFRAVHDAFGHGLEGAGFRAQGEENAWQAHVRLFTGSAIGAITSETRGQNSWLNFGPYGGQNQTAKVEDTVFADQKTGLMPEWTWTEGLVPNAQVGATFNQAMSTRVPTAKKGNPENPVDNHLSVNLAAAKDSPGLLPKLVNAVSKYVNYPKTRVRNDEARAEVFVQHAVDNLLWLYDLVPAAIRARSKLWYVGANRIAHDWAAKYGLDPSQTAAVLAVLSPQKDWFQNVSLAERILDTVFNKGDVRWDDQMEKTAQRIYKKKQYAEDLDAIRGKTLNEITDSSYLKAMWIRVHDETYNTRDYRVVTPEGAFADWSLTKKGKRQKVAWGSNAEIAKAVSAIRNGSKLNLHSQIGENHKVRSFYNNIFDPYHATGEVTIDTHAVAAALIRPLAGKDVEVADNFGKAGKSALTGVRGTYALYAEAYRRAAALRGVLPREMQSVTWEAVRGLFPDTFKTQGNKDRIDSMWAQWKKGEVSLNELRNEIVKLGGRVDEPAWLKSGFGENEPAWASSYSDVVREAGVRGGQSGGTRRGEQAGGAGAVREGPFTLKQSGVPQPVSIPVFGESRPDGIDVVGVHFSTEARDSLDGSKYGTGMKGAERDAVMNHADKRLRNRVFFYVPEGQGVQAEKLVGSQGHIVKLQGLYDAEADPLGIWKQGGESAVLDAGFSGYYARGSFGKQGTAVVFPKAPIKVQHFGGEGTINSMLGNERAPAGKYTEGRAAANELVQAKDLPAGQMPRGQWARILELMKPQLFEKLADLGAFKGNPDEVVYRDELVRTFAQSRQQTQTEAFKEWFGDSKVVDANGEPLVVYHGSKNPNIDQFAFYRSEFSNVRSQPSTRMPGWNDVLGAAKEQGDSVLLGRWMEADGKAVVMNANGGMEVLPLHGRPASDVVAELLNPEGPVSDRVAAGHHAFFFSEDPAYTGFYSIWGRQDSTERPTTYPVYLSIQNPILPSSWPDFEEFYREATNGDARKLELAKQAFLNQRWEAFEAFPGLIEFAQAKGYDGYQLVEGGASAMGLSPVTETAPGGVRTWAVFSPEQIKTATGDPSTFGQGEQARGQIAFGNDITQTPSVITLLKNADLSTFIHESGHFYLEVLNHIASQPNAPADIVEDFDKVLQWFGVKDAATWNSMSLEEKRPYHEQFARGFEAYAFEGKAPSVGLRKMFQRFAAWMKAVYRNASNLNVELDDEIRGVFDRMLASDEEIKQAEAARGYAPAITSKPPSMTDEEWADYQSTGQQATLNAAEELTGKALRNMAWLSRTKAKVVAQITKSAREARKAIRREVEDEVRQQPVYAAEYWLKKGILPDGTQTVGAKLDLAALKEMYGEGPAAPWRYLNNLAGNEGMHPDQVAEMFGFRSGDHLVRELLAAEAFRSVVDGMTDQRMLERHGEIADPEGVERAAEEAIHNEVRAKFLATELQALEDMTNPRADTGRTNSKGRKITQALLPKAAREFAEAIIGRQKVREIKVSPYEIAEARAGRNANEAMKKGDVQAAAVEKRNQLINFYAVKAARQALEDVTKAVDYLKKFDRKATRESLSPDYLDQIDKLLERFDLRRSSNRELDRRQSLLDWVEAQRANGIEPEIPQELLNEAARTSYRNMTVEELRGLVDTVRQIEHLGRLKSKLLKLADKREFEAFRDEAVNHIEENAKKVTPEIRKSDRGLLVGAKRLFRTAIAVHRKFASMIREMDGYKDGGFMWNHIVRPMNELGDKEAGRLDTENKTMVDLLAPLMAKGQPKMTARKDYASSGKSFTREERIALLLNMGNETNRERIITGERLTEAQLADILSDITPEEAAFANKAWEYLDSFWPEVVEKQKRLTGVVPKKVDSTPFVLTLRDGTQVSMRGGYFPIAYDPDLNTKSAADATAEVAKQMERGMYVAAQTRRGHTKARAESTGRKLRLDFGHVMAAHVQQVVHDLTWHEYLIDTNRLLKDKAVDAAIREHYGQAVLKELQDTLRDIAIGQGGIERMGPVWNYLRHGTTVALMGLNLFNAVQNLTGFTNSMSRIGTKWALKGAIHWAGDAVKFENSVAKIREKSEFMRLREKTFDREVNDIRNKVTGKSGVASAVMFWFAAKTQIMVDTPTWWGAYEKAMHDVDNEARAVALADQAVRDAQGGGQLFDNSGIMRGGQAMKLLTALGGYFSNVFNLTHEAYTRTDFKKPGDVLALAADMALLYTIPALLTTLLKAALSGDWDDPEKLKRKLIADQLTYLIGPVMGLREAGAAINAAFGQGGGYSGPAGMRLFASLSELGKQAAQGEIDAAFLKALNMTAGLLFHYPAAQINKTAEGVAALSDGKTSNPGVLLTGPAK